MANFHPILLNAYQIGTISMPIQKQIERSALYQQVVVYRHQDVHYVLLTISNLKNIMIHFKNLRDMQISHHLSRFLSESFFFFGCASL